MALNLFIYISRVFYTDKISDITEPTTDSTENTKYELDLFP